MTEGYTTLNEPLCDTSKAGWPVVVPADTEVFIEKRGNDYWLLHEGKWFHVGEDTASFL